MLVRGLFALFDDRYSAFDGSYQCGQKLWQKWLERLHRVGFGSEHDQSDVVDEQVLLVLEALVGGDYDIERLLHRGGQKFAVDETGPA